MAEPQTFLQGLQKSATIDAQLEQIGKQEPAEIIAGIILWILGLAAVIAVAAVIWGGFLYIASFGDENRAAQGKKVILYAVVGLILAGGSFFIIQQVRELLI